MSRAYLLSLLVKKRAELGDEFVGRFPHAWLVWDADSWSAPSLDGATRILTAHASRSSSGAAESLCYALTPRVGRPTLQVGRSSDLDIVINDGTVSRQHAVLFQDPTERWRLQVVTANARTMYQDRALSRGNEVGLVDGDRVEFGDVRLRFLSARGLHESLGRRLVAATR